MKKKGGVYIEEFGKREGKMWSYYNFEKFKNQIYNFGWRKRNESRRGICVCVQYISVYVCTAYMYDACMRACLQHTYLCVCVIDMCSCCMQMCTSSGSSRTPHDNEMKLDRSDEYLCQIKPYWKFSKTGEYFNSDVWFICNYMNNS